MPITQRTRLTQPERSARTRAALLAAARDLFTEQGFAETGREQIAERAGMTRGALYHHFASKADVAAAVVDELEAELLERVVGAAGSGEDAVDQLRRACHAYLDACTEPAIARILLTDAPAVLGLAELRARDAASCIPLLRDVLVAAAAQGVVVPGDPEVAAALLLGLLNEAAMLIGSAGDKVDARARVGATVDAFLERLLGAR
jgi:AcrR family transcriptional regulator